MDNLDKLSLSELRETALKMDISPNQSKSILIQEIRKCFREYEKYKENSRRKYKRIKQLGKKGKEGRTFLVRTRKEKEYAMKTFSRRKSSVKIKVEADFQKRAASVDISPKIIEVDTVLKFIVMEKLDRNLFQVLADQNGKLTIPQQKKIMKLFDTLDRIGIFHRDPNPLNIMTKKGRWYIIDYGFAVNITDSLKKKHSTNRLNHYFMAYGLVTKLREISPTLRLNYIEKVIKT